MFQEYVPCVARRSLRPKTTDKHQFERKGQFTEHRMKRFSGGIILQTYLNSKMSAYCL